MRRHRVATYKPPLNKIDPKPGMLLQVYMSDRVFGSGVRLWLVLGASNRYVTLFYQPLLRVLRIKRKDWPSYVAECCGDRCDAERMTKLVLSSRDVFRAANMRFNASHTKQALDVLSKGNVPCG